MVHTKCKESIAQITMKEIPMTKKTLITFSIQVPIPKPPADAPPEEKKPDSLFKNSRLMLHEIIEVEDVEIKEDTKENEDKFIKPNERLEVVKITGCKMRAKDVLEIEIGLKNLRSKSRIFMERRFMLRFLNKLDPELACKGRLIITGRDLEQLQKLQEAKVAKDTEPKDSSPGEKTNRTSQSQKLKKDLIREDTSLPQLDCYLKGPITFNHNIVSIIDFIPEHIHVAPIVFTDFS